jgi:hypothetical protein
LYWTQKSVSRISAAAANLSIAASPSVISLSSPNAFEAEPMSAAPGPRATAPNPTPRRKARLRILRGGAFSSVLLFEVELLGNASVGVSSVFIYPSIATACAEWWTGKVTRLLLLGSVGTSDRFADRVSDVAHCLNQLRRADFFSQSPDEDFHQFGIVFVRMFPDAFAQFRAGEDATGLAY